MAVDGWHEDSVAINICWRTNKHDSTVSRRNGNSRTYGKPDLFLTVTCNPKWPEITNELHPHQTAADRLDLVASVFKSKLSALIKEITKKEIFGKVIGYVRVIEFQKRGLPHSHMLIILNQDAKPKTIEDFDALVSAEIRQNQTIRELIAKHMMYGPCEWRIQIALA